MKHSQHTWCAVAVLTGGGCGCGCWDQKRSLIMMARGEQQKESPQTFGCCCVCCCGCSCYCQRARYYLNESFIGGPDLRLVLALGRARATPPHTFPLETPTHSAAGLPACSLFTCRPPRRTKVGKAPLERLSRNLEVHFKLGAQTVPLALSSPPTPTPSERLDTLPGP